MLKQQAFPNLLIAKELICVNQRFLIAHNNNITIYQERLNVDRADVGPAELGADAKSPDKNRKSRLDFSNRDFFVAGARTFLYLQT